MLKKFTIITFLFLLSFNALAQQTQTAEEYLNDLLEQADTELDELRAYYRAYTKVDNENLFQKKEYLNKALEIARTLDDAKYKVIILTNLASIYSDSGEFSKAKELIDRATSLADSTGDIESIVSARWAQNNFELYLGAYEEALEGYNELLTLLPKAGYDEKSLIYNTAFIYGNMATIYIRLNQPYKSLEYYKMIQDILKDSEYPNLYFTNAQSIIVLYIDNGEYSKAIETADEIIPQTQEYKFEETTNHIKVLKARALQLRYKKTNDPHDLAEAKIILDDLQLNKNNPAYSFRLLMEKVRSAIAYGQFDEAEQIIDRAEQMDLINLDKNDNPEVYELLADLYASQSDYKKSYEIMQQLRALEKKTFDDKISENISRMQIRFDTERKEKELIQEKANNKLLLKDAAIKTYIIIIISLATIIAIGLIVIITLNLKRKKKMAEEFEKLSKIDPLTQLMNRRAMLEKLEEESLRIERTDNSFVLILSDIDHFKRFNDTYGHKCGDKVLKLVAQIFTDSLRDIDFVSRWGGEEFLIILPETNHDDGMNVAEKLRQLIESAHLDWNNETLSVTMSFGLCECNKDLNFNECIIIADENLYRAKEQGRNRIFGERKEESNNIITR